MIALAAVGLAAGVPVGVLVIALAAVRWPLPSAALLLLAIARTLRQRAQGTAPEVAALVAIAADLRAGGSLRQALESAAAQLPAFEPARRVARAGRPMSDIAPLVVAALPSNGRLAATALTLADDVGGSVAPVFDELAAQAIDADEVRRERRVAMAPAVAQGVVVGGIPMLAAVWMGLNGRLVELVTAGSVGASLVMVGLGCTLLGVIAVAVIVWRTVR